MANNPDDAKPQRGTASDGAADYVRTKQELDAAEAQRQTDGELDATRQARTDVSAPAKSHPKLHKSEEAGPIQDTSGEPFVEDEP